MRIPPVLILITAMLKITQSFRISQFITLHRIKNTVCCNAVNKIDSTITESIRYDENGRKFIEEIVQKYIRQTDEEILLENENDVSINNDDDLLNSVVRVYCTHSEPNFNMPWQRRKQESSTSSGFVISIPDAVNKQNRSYILSNAHSVEYGSIIQVKKRQSEKKYLAKVLAVGHECDLAMLDVEDQSFWDGIIPLTFGVELPDLLEDVQVVGYPVGGDSISISSGVVSRIEMQEYAQASAELLAIQIDAAINPGNSGGPVVNSDGEVIGVAFQSLSDEDIENIGYVVPVNVIKHFIEDVRRHNSFSGVVGLGVRLQGMENDYLRRYYGMVEDVETGILVTFVYPLAPSQGILEKGDIILTIDGIRIANDGTIPFREGRFSERVQFSNYLSQLFPYDIVKLKILRNNERIFVDVPVWVNEPLVPSILTKRTSNINNITNNTIIGTNPSYLVIGGLVFSALTKEYIRSEFRVRDMSNFEGWDNEYRILSLINQPKSVSDEEVILLIQVIAHNCNIGYENYSNLQLVSFNGIKIINLQHLKELYDKINSKHLVFEFTNNLIIILDTQSALDAQPQILQEHFIPSFCSNDLI